MATPHASGCDRGGLRTASARQRRCLCCQGCQMVLLRLVACLTWSSSDKPLLARGSMQRGLSFALHLQTGGQRSTRNSRSGGIAGSACRRSRPCMSLSLHSRSEMDRNRCRSLGAPAVPLLASPSQRSHAKTYGGGYRSRPSRAISAARYGAQGTIP